MAAGAWTPSLPESETSAWLAPVLIAVISGAGFASGWLKARRGWRTGMTRKLFHFVIFTAAVALSTTIGHAGVNLLGGLVALYVFTLVRVGEGNFFYEALARESDAPRRSLYIIVPFIATAAGGLLSSFWFAELAAIGFVASGWGDAAGEPIGLRFGRHRYRVPSITGSSRCERSFEGSAAVFVATAVGVAALIVATGWTGDALAIAATSLAVAIATALVEAVSHHGIDNLTIQLAASATGYAVLSGFGAVELSR